MAYAQSLLTLSLVLQRQSKYDAAEPLLRQAMDELKEPLPLKGRQIKESCQHLLAEVLFQHHRKFSEAEQLLRQILSNTEDEGAEPTISVIHTLARILMVQDRDIEAEELFRQILNADEQFSDRSRILRTRGLARALHKQGRLIEAEDLVRQASEDVLVHGPADMRSQVALLALGKAILAQKAYGEAASVLRTACDAIATPYHLTHLRCLHALGYALRRLNDHDQGMSFYTRALEGHKRMHGVDHQLTRELSRAVDKYRAFLAVRGLA